MIPDLFPVFNRVTIHYISEYYLNLRAALSDDKSHDTNDILLEIDQADAWLRNHDSDGFGEIQRYFKRSKQSMLLTLKKLKLASLWEDVFLLDSNAGKHSAAEYLKDKVVAIYFSMGNCSFSGAILPELKTFYDAIKTENRNFEVIFVTDLTSSDPPEDQNSDAKWLTVEYDQNFTDFMANLLSVQFPPALKVIKHDGTIVENNGITAVHLNANNPIGLFESWKALIYT
uniref:protein-disulfide reductase n=1 Tax=Panagrellus redivivus TaxID=6233 RepID=A0A7E4UR33_PANRE